MCERHGFNAETQFLSLDVTRMDSNHSPEMWVFVRDLLNYVGMRHTAPAIPLGDIFMVIITRDCSAWKARSAAGSVVSFVITAVNILASGKRFTLFLNTLAAIAIATMCTCDNGRVWNLISGVFQGDDSSVAFRQISLVSTAAMAQAGVPVKSVITRGFFEYCHFFFRVGSPYAAVDLARLVLKLLFRPLPFPANAGIAQLLERIEQLQQAARDALPTTSDEWEHVIITNCIANDIDYEVALVLKNFLAGFVNASKYHVATIVVNPAHHGVWPALHSNTDTTLAINV
jgi:hypothetical protein